MRTRTWQRVGYLRASRQAPRKAWQQSADDARARGEELQLKPIGLHESYASFLMAAAYTLRELMEYMGDSSLQATERYVKLLPQPAGPNGAADSRTRIWRGWGGRRDPARCEHVANNRQCSGG